MRVTFQIDGGIAHFPGLAAPTVLDAAEFTEAERAEVRALLEQEAPPAAARRARPDAQRYVVTVEDEGRRKTVTLSDPVEDPRLAAVVEMLRTKTIAARRRPKP